MLKSYKWNSLSNGWLSKKARDYQGEMKDQTFGNGKSFEWKKKNENAGGHHEAKSSAVTWIYDNKIWVNYKYHR